MLTAKQKKPRQCKFLHTLAVHFSTLMEFLKCKSGALGLSVTKLSIAIKHEQQIFHVLVKFYVGCKNL